VLLGLVTRCSWRKIAALVPLAVAVAFAVNFCRLAALARLADRGDFVRFDYWHLGPGSLLHPLVATVALLAVALPLTAPRMSAGPARN
jgi:exosortase/archaeosortase family protein